MTNALDAGSVMQKSSFEKVAEFVFDPLDDVPDSVLSHAALLLIDTLGVAAGASTLDVGKIARDYAVEFYAAASEKNAATLLFDGRRASLPGAAWALATQIDNLDAHDGYYPTKGHIGCAVVPALFAFAEHNQDLSGPDALRAMIAAYEVATRAAISLHDTVSDYHTSGAWNALGVAALGCRLMGNDADRLQHALGIAEYHGPRSQMMREIDNPTMLHDGSGMGALVGSSAALLAARGFTGAPAITVEASDVEHHWQNLGNAWTVDQNYIKPYPICRWAHPAIDALRQMMRQVPDICHSTVDSINVRTFAEAACLYAGVPGTTSEAQYSLNFALAVMLRYGEIGPSHIRDEGLRDASVAELVPKITASVDARHSDRFPQGRWCDIEVRLCDGRIFASGDVQATGGPGAWRSEAEVEEKFHLFCSEAVTPTRSKAIWNMRHTLLDRDTRFSDLFDLVRNGADF